MLEDMLEMDDQEDVAEDSGEVMALIMVPAKHAATVAKLVEILMESDFEKVEPEKPNFGMRADNLPHFGAMAMDPAIGKGVV